MMEITAALKMHAESLRTRENISDISLIISGKGRLETWREVVMVAHLGSVSVGPCVSGPNSHHSAE